MKNASLENYENFMLDVVKNEVDQMTDEKIMALSKSSVSPNREKIKQECEQHVLNKINEELKKQFQDCNQFYEELYVAYPELYTKVVNMMGTGEPQIDKATLEEIANIGHQYIAEEQWEKSYLYFFFLTLVDSENAVNWLLKGVSEHNQGKFEDALISYNYALARQPEYPFAQIQRMKCLMALRHIPEAKLHYSDFQELYDLHPELHDDYFSKELMQIKKELAA